MSDGRVERAALDGSGLECVEQVLGKQRNLPHARGIADTGVEVEQPIGANIVEGIVLKHA